MSARSTQLLLATFARANGVDAHRLRLVNEALARFDWLIEKSRRGEVPDMACGDRLLNAIERRTDRRMKKLIESLKPRSTT